MGTAISVDNLSFTYPGGEEVLRGVSFEVKSGATLSIIGPNGSGKTTLLRICLGLLQPTQGHVRVLGSEPAEVRSRVGYVPQRFHFDRSFPMRVREFLAASTPGHSKERLRRRLASLQVEYLAERSLGQLSSGELQRVLIVSAMMRDPEILYLDEPSSGVDAGGEAGFYEIVEHIRKEHRASVVLVSHEIDLVYRFSDMVCRGSPDRALTPEVITELYGREAGVYRHGAQAP